MSQNAHILLEKFCQTFLIKAHLVKYIDNKQGLKLRFFFFFGIDFVFILVVTNMNVVQ